jgi:HAD superfamily hydrolase (TIGR01509 family)
MFFIACAKWYDVPMKTIFFDFFNVLSTPAYTPVVQKYIPENEQPEWERKIQLVDLGEMHEDDFIRQLAKRGSVADFKIWEEIDRDVELNEQLIEYIKSDLKPAYKIGLLTNAARSLIERLFGDRLELFDTIIISSDYGIIKPDPRIYEAAIAQAKVSAGETMFVDDNPLNIEGAQKAGMKGIVFENVGQMKAELQKHLS